jgi:hypothetical protein
VNVLKGKQLTNIRAAGKDEAVRLTHEEAGRGRARWMTEAQGRLLEEPAPCSNYFFISTASVLISLPSIFIRR